MRGVIMNNKIKSEKFRKLSIVALVTGILGISPTIISPLLDPTVEKFMTSSLSNVGVLLIIGLQIVSYGGFGLSIAAVVCGSIDLKRIQAGRYSNKGRGFDITGIVLGGIPLLTILVMLPLEFIFPH